MQTTPKNKAIFNTEQMKEPKMVEALYAMVDRPGEVNPLDSAYAAGVLIRMAKETRQDGPGSTNGTVGGALGLSDKKGLEGALDRFCDEIGDRSENARKIARVAALLVARRRVEKEIEQRAAQRAAM